MPYKCLKRGLGIILNGMPDFLEVIYLYLSSSLHLADLFYSKKRAGKGLISSKASEHVGKMTEGETCGGLPDILTTIPICHSHLGPFSSSLQLFRYALIPEMHKDSGERYLIITMLVCYSLSCISKKSIISCAHKKHPSLFSP